MTQLLTNPPAIPPGLIEAIEAAGHSVARAPEGWYVSDLAAVQAIVNAYVGSAFELAYHKQGKLDALAAVYGGKFANGLSYVGPDSVARTFQLDQASQFNIDVLSNAALGTILAGEPWDANSYFIAADNGHMPLSTAQAMRNFGVAVKNYVSRLILTNRAIKDMIGAAANTKALAPLDVTAGWPSNP